MNDQWINEYCGTCYFKVDDDCRENPPTATTAKTDLRQIFYWAEYPRVCRNFPACSKWLLKENKENKENKDEKH